MGVENSIIFIRRFLTSVFFGVVFVVIPIVFLTVISSKTSALMGIKSFTVLTGSMTPLIPVGSVVYVFPSKAYEVGDVITFKRGNINVTHRIVDTVDRDGKHVSPFISPVSGWGVQEVFYKTRGDANSSADNEVVASRDILGKTMFHFPSIGKFASFIKTMPGFLGLVILPISLFVLAELFNIKKELEKETEKRILERIGRRTRYEQDLLY